MAIGRKGKPGNVTISPENTKTGDFNHRTLSGSFFVIPEHLASICAVVLAFTTINSQLYCALVPCGMDALKY